MGKQHKHKIVSLDGPPCPRCGAATEVREHDVIRDRQLKAPFYYSRWYYCRRSGCATTLIMPPEFKVFREQRVEWS